jgi:GH35 family endo-1,4-beta-xylanase
MKARSPARRRGEADRAVSSTVRAVPEIPRSIERVTTWGTFDGESWKNNFPVRGRTNYPLFDRQMQRKPAYAGIASLKQPGSR